MRKRNYVFDYREPASSVISKWAVANHKDIDMEILVTCEELASMPLFGGNAGGLLNPDNTKVIENIYNTAKSLHQAATTRDKRKAASKYIKEVRRIERDNQDEY